MLCPKCNSETKVINSRVGGPNGEVRRRRECTNAACKHRFTTLEVLLEGRMLKPPKLPIP